MTSTEQRRTIATSLGWEEIARWKWRAPDGMIHEHWGGELNCPDYLTDLNTRPAMLAHLDARNLRVHMTYDVLALMGTEYDPPDGPSAADLWALLTVPQPVFAEAFLHACALWTEEPDPQTPTP